MLARKKRKGIYGRTSKVSVILMIVLFVLTNTSTITYGTSHGFPDINQEWMYLPVNWGVSRDIVSGYPDGTFRPATQVKESEFVTMMARYVKLVDLGTLSNDEGEHWSQAIYDILEGYALPLKGYKDNKAKDTGLSRGQLARIVAAKNGFNLDERQAVYYLYENELSTGKIAGRLDFESYDAKAALTRAEAVAFLQRLDDVGITTFKGQSSGVAADEMGGIKDVPKDNSPVDFNDFKEDDFEYARKIADKHGRIFDSFENVYAIKNNEGLVRYTHSSDTGFTIHVNNYSVDKDIFMDVLRGRGLSEKSIGEIIHIIEVVHRENSNIPEYIRFSQGTIRVTGDYESERGLSLQFGLRK